MVHEFTHVLGWGSFVTDNPVLGSAYSTNQYSRYDEKFLYHGDVTTGPLTKIVNNSGPSINSGLPANALINKQLWVYGNLENDPSNNQNVPGFANLAYAFGSSPPPNSSSHLGEYADAFNEVSYKAPGFIQNYVMGPLFWVNHIKDVWTEQELRMLRDMGYQFTSSFLLTNAHVPANRHPYTSKVIYDNTWAGTGPILMSETDLNPADLPPIDNCNTAVFNLATDPTIHDADGDPIRIFPGSLYNIRGCSNGGINHNCLSITNTPAGDIITYTPRPDFIGRAQFGFHLYDGKEKGELFVYTIDVTGCNPCGTNLVVNGNFEEGMEIKTLTNPLVDNASVSLYRNMQYTGLISPIYPDGSIFCNRSSLVTEEAQGCPQNVGSFWSPSFNPGPGVMPAIFGTKRYYYPGEPNNYFKLCTGVQNCGRYVLEFDIYTNVNMNPVTIGFTDNPISTFSTLSFINPVTQNVSAGATWQHIIIPINYCSTTVSDYLVFQFPTYTPTVFIDNLNLYVDPSPAPVLSSNINPASQSICAGQSVSMNATVTNPRCNVTYNWSPGGYTTSSITDAPPATTNYLLTVNDGCSTTTSNALVTVNPLPNVTASVSSPTVCTLYPSTVLTANGASTYAWLPGPPFSGSPITVSPTSTTLYTVTGTSAAGCTNSVTVLITYTACGTCTSCIQVGTSGTVVNASPVAGVYCLNNNVLITGNVNLNASELKIGAGWQITIASTGVLSIKNSHLYSCGNMWQGIVIQNGGKLIIDASLIEDAFVAIDITGNTQTGGSVIDLNNTTFNRNDIAINIKGYTQTVNPYPFLIKNCVITCRNIPFTPATSPSTVIFPSAASIGAAATNVGAPFTNGVINNTTYKEILPISPSAPPNMPYLKAPFAANTKPTAGIRLTNVGVTQNPQTTAPTYYEFVLGGIGNKNIIDNQRVGVDLIQSNYTSYNATYQNMTPYGGHNNQGGIGINANAGDISNNRLRVTSVLSLTALTGNNFVNCSRAINTVNYFEHIISFNDIRSSQSTAASTPNHRGEFGVRSITNRFRIYNVSSNTIYNIQNGIIMDGTFGPLNIPTIVNNGQYAGKINVDNNTFDPQIGTSNITTNFIGDAISLSTISGAWTAANAPYPIFQSANNTITNAYRGITYNKWNKINCIINSNNITLVNDVFVANNLQYGIQMTGCTPAIGQSSVRSNNVFGYGITNPKLAGIISSQSMGNLVSCNTTTNTTGGIVFAGACNGASFSQNTMNNNQYGFVLTNSGVTGQLGATNVATDNKWPGAWPAPARYKTATINSSAAGSPLWVRQIPLANNPNGSGYTSFPTTSYGTDDYFWAISNTGTLKYVAGAPANPICPILSSGGGGTNPAVSNFIQQLEQIALDQISYAANQITQARFINKANLLSMLKGDPSLTAGSPILQTFTATSVNTSRDKFTTVEDQTAKGNLGTAGSVNASISPTISIESNHKDFYATLLNYANHTLTTSDSITVATLSNGCPFTDGSVVYQARALYNVMFDTYQVFIDNCTSNVTSRLVKPEEEVKDLSSLFDAAIFPNPGSSNFNIATFGLTEGNVDVTISDVTGKVVYESKLQISNSLTNFTIDVKGGVYFVKIFDSTVNKTLIKKLVVQQ